MAAEIEKAQEDNLKQEALTIGERAARIQIVDQQTYDQATALLLLHIIPWRKKWAEYWKPLKEAAWNAHKAVTSKFNDGDQPAEAAEREIKQKIRVWDDEQQRLRQAEQRKAQEEAERKEQEERLAAAVAAENSGATDEEVEQIVSAPIVATAAPVAPTYARASGITSRDNYKAECFDIKALCRAVGAGKISTEYVLPNMPALNARAKADKKTMNIPGCRVKNERIVSGMVK